MNEELIPSVGQAVSVGTVPAGIRAGQDRLCPRGGLSTALGWRHPLKGLR